MKIMLMIISGVLSVGRISAQTPILTVVSPTNDAVLEAGSRSSISWDSSGIPTGASAVIYLRPWYYNSERGGDLFAVTTNSGSFEFVVPTNRQEGYYTMQILSGGIFAQSERFYLKQRPMYAADYAKTNGFVSFRCRGGADGVPVRVMASSDLTNWVHTGIFTSNGAPPVVLPIDVSIPARYYRLENATLEVGIVVTNVCLTNQVIVAHATASDRPTANAYYWSYQGPNGDHGWGTQNSSDYVLMPTQEGAYFLTCMVFSGDWCVTQTVAIKVIYCFPDGG